MNSSATKHLAMFPHARSSTLSALIERDKVLEQLKIEASYNRRRKAISRFKGWVLWPIYVWGW